MIAVPYKTSLPRLPLLAAAFVVLICIAIIALSGWREWTSRDIVLNTAELEMANLARSLTQHAEDTVQLAESMLIGVVSGLETDGAKPEKIARIQSILDRRKPGLGRIRGLFVYDQYGNWLATTEAVNLASYNNSDRDYFRYHRGSEDRRIHIGPPLQSRSGGQWVTTLSQRWNHPDGTFGGVVLATVDATYFSNFYSRFNTGKSGAITLLNANGIVMARSPDDGSYVGRDTSSGPLFREPMLQSAGGVHYFKSPLDGLQRLSFYERSDRFPIVVLASMQQDEVLAPWRSAAISRMLFVLGLVALIAVIGLYLVRQLLRGQRMVAALASKEANFRVLAEGSSDMVTRIGLDERVHYASPSSVRVVGWGPDQLVGSLALAGVNPLDLPGVEDTVSTLRRGGIEEARISYRTRHREKSEIWVESTLRVTRTASGEIDGVVAITRDVTQHKNLEHRLETLAIEDGLTGLANRRHFDERLQEEWSRASRDHTFLSLLMIDIDHFKAFNDTYGHPAGDECLRSVAAIFSAEAQRTTDLPARYGGEEFAMLLPNTDAAGCARIGERIHRALRDAGIPHALNLPSEVVTASLGGATCRPATERSAGYASLVQAADRALYSAKDGGRDRLVMSGLIVSLLPAAAGAR